MQHHEDYSGIASGAVQAALEIIHEEAELRLELKAYLEAGCDALALLSAAKLVGANIDDFPWPELCGERHGWECIGDVP
jgi:hypothetical protein